MLGCGTVTFEELCNILTDIDVVINSRPLTRVSCDEDEVEPLTPAHFLIGNSEDAWLPCLLMEDNQLVLMTAN
ncbi:hypothetical protein MRX96_055083 [Rhipicephalus microplus]